MKDFVANIGKFQTTRLSRKIAYYYASEGSLSKKNKEIIIRNCENMIRDLENLKISHNNVNLLRILQRKLFGYDINLSSVVKVLTVNGRLKSQSFLLLYYARNLYRYGLQHFFEKRDEYEINLIDFDNFSKTTPKKENIETAFLTSDPAYTRSYFDLFKVLDEKEEKYLLILPRKAKNWGSYKELGKYKHLRVVFIEDFFNHGQKKELTQNIDKYSKFFEKNKKKLSRIMRVGSLNFFPFVRKPLKVSFNRYLPEVVSYMDLAERIYSHFNVKKIVGCRMRRLVEVSFFYTAKEMNIKSFSIMHAWDNNSIQDYYDVGDFDVPNVVICWTDSQKKMIESIRRTKRAKILAWGNPQFQKISAFKPKNISMEKIGLDDKKKLVVYMMPSFIYRNIMEDLISVCKELDANLVCKKHPKDKKGKKIYNKFDTVVLDDDSIDLYSLLSRADAMINIGSTTLFESLLLGTPGIVYQPLYKQYIDLQKFMVLVQQLNPKAKCIMTREELKKELKKILSRPKKETVKEYKHLENLFPKYKDKTSSQMVELISK